VKSTTLIPAVLVLELLLPAGAQTTQKVAVINIQSAIVSTKDGQKAASSIQARFNPKKAELDRRQAEIGQLQEQLNRGRSTLTDDARQNLVREIDQKTKSLNRDTEDARAELDQEQQKIMNELGGRMMQVIGKYASDNGFSLVLDDSNPQTPIVYASSVIEITKEIIDLYDKNSPSATATAPAAAPSRATQPGVPAPKPSVPAK
jgi:outer membrane protein